MAQPTTRQQFREKCLRNLGHPVIKINISEDQIEDSIDDALSYWNDYHYDGTEYLFFRHEVTQADLDNKYITLPDEIIGVVDIFNISEGLTSSGMFSPQYQFALSNIQNMASFKLKEYYMAMTHISLIQDILVGQTSIRYNRHVNRLHIDDWKGLNVGSIVLVKVYQALDGSVYSDIWKDKWLQDYTTYKIQEKWGRILTKFTGMQLPGNIQFDGERILSTAQEKIREMEQEMITNYSLPVCDMRG